MSDVSILGLGHMGSALAHTLLGNGHKVTVWNRNSSKAAPLLQQGATLAESAAQAISASPVTIICVTDYQTSYSILEEEQVKAALPGKVLVQLSTGTPQQARDNQAWAQAQGASYLDGAIAATPRQIGERHTSIFVAGEAQAFKQSEPLLKQLAGNVPYLGKEVGAASAVDLAFLSFLFGSMSGFFHGIRILEAEGLPINTFGVMLAGTAAAIGGMMEQSARAISVEAYGQPESSLKICAEGVELLRKQANEARINSAFPDFASQLFTKALAAGYGDEAAAALIKVLRANAA